MSAELIVDIKANINDALRKLKQFEDGLKGAGQGADGLAGKMPKLGKATAGANTALVNFGRVVQDAPFGLIGIANNIDPLLTSFSQLKKETGSTGAAFKSLAAGLAGPAGIAIAVSAVTSLLIAYGDEIQKAIFGTDQYAKAIEEAASGAAADAIKINILTSALKSGTLSAEEQAKAQRELVKISPDFKNAFDGGAVSVGKLDAALGKANQRLLEQIKISAATNILQKEFEKLAATVASGGELSTFQKVVAGIRGALSNPLAPSLGASVKETVTQFQNLTAAQKQIEDFGNRINEVFGALNISFSSYVQNYDSGTEKLKKKTKEVRQEIEKLGEVQRIGAFNLTNFGQLPTTAPSQVNIAASSEQVAQNIERVKLLVQGLKLDRQIEQAEQLNGIINNGINAGIDQFFNALANNQNPFDALVQSVKRLVVELAAAVIKMFVLKTIANSIAPGSGTAIGGTQGLLSGIGGFATGGFVSQPTLATIAENGPEFVLRPDQLGAIMNMGGGGGFQQVGVSITGEQLYILLQRTTNRKARNF